MSHCTAIKPIKHRESKYQAPKYDLRSIDTLLEEAVVPNTNFEKSFNLVKPGTYSHNRTSRSVHGVAIKCRFKVVNNSQQHSLFYRIMIFYDTNPTAPQSPPFFVPQLLQTANNDGVHVLTPVSYVFGGINPDFTDRFLVLYDELHHLEGKGGNQGDYDTIHCIDRAIPGLDTEFNTAVTETLEPIITRGQLRFLFCTQTSELSQTPVVTGYLRYIFCDSEQP